MKTVAFVLSVCACLGRRGVWTLLLFPILVSAQVLNLPPRPPHALSGSEFVNVIKSMPAPSPGVISERESWIQAQIMGGNVPNFLRNLVQVSTNAVINGTSHTVSYWVTPDYLAVGSDEDYFLEPMTPILAQRLATLLGCSLPTSKMVNDIWAKASVKLAPSPISPTPEMITVPVFATHNAMVWQQRQAEIAAHPLGALVAGDKKDVIISYIIYNNLKGTVPKPVVIYGWHYQNGTPIQPRYNGHEETYADYSHGIRLVQNPIRVDGLSKTVAEVLNDPNLARLLCDETNITIPKPYYTVAAQAPIVVVQPGSVRVKQGGKAELSVMAIGDAPLVYQWRLNGTSLFGATNSVLTVTNVQGARAGAYSVRVSNASGAVTSSVAAVKISSVAQPVKFADDFNLDSSANWNVCWGSANGLPDYSTDWAFDYGVIHYTFNGVTRLIPPAPNCTDGTTRGVRLAVNSGDTNAAVAGVNIYPKGQIFCNNFALKFDMWLNYPGGVGGIGSGGSTQTAIFGANHTGTNANWAATSAARTDGVWFGVAGEGGASRDYCAYVGNLSGTQTELIGLAASGLAESNSAAVLYQGLFPASDFETAGSPGKNWVEVELDQVDGVLTWKVNGTTIAYRANTSGFTNGTIMLGLMDLYSSIASPAEDAFVIFDNVRVEDLSVAPTIAPTITSAPAGQDCSAGRDVVLLVSASGSQPLNYQWYLNGLALNQQTNAVLTLNNVQPAAEGLYSVVVSNAAGSVWSDAVAVSVSPFPTLGAAQVSSEQLQFRVMGLAATSYLVERSNDLVNWLPVQTNQAPFWFVGPVAVSETAFFRARQF